MQANTGSSRFGSSTLRFLAGPTGTVQFVALWQTLGWYNRQVLQHLQVQEAVDEGVNDGVVRNH